MIKQIKNKFKHFIISFYFNHGGKLDHRNLNPEELIQYETNKKLLSYFSASKAQKAIGNNRLIQITNLKIFKLFLQFAKINNFKYWADCGTLLGAVRHKGFIPWDDDIDISAFYEDTIKILPKMKKYFDKHNLIVRERDEFNHFQIRITQKTYNKHIGLDIFLVKPLHIKSIDNISQYISLNNTVNKASKKWFTIIKKKYNYLDIDSIRFQISKIENKYIYKYNNNRFFNYAFYGLDYPTIYKNKIINLSDVFPLRYLAFEDILIPCPNHYDEYLKLNYGDYMSLPKNIYTER